MPYSIGQRGNEWCVLDDDDNPVPGGCHPTRDEALRHQRALMVNVPDAQQGAASTCSCGGHGPNIHPLAVSAARLAASTEPFDAAFPVPAYPPREWFTERPTWLQTPNELAAAHLAAGGDPEDMPIPRLRIDDEGRVAGYFYGAGQCLVYRHEACPSPSPTFYAAFHQSEVVCADGESILCGVMGNVHGHADPYARADIALRHYQDPSAQLVALRAYDDDHGGYVLGAVIAGVTYGDVALLRRSPLSGDWRPMPDTWFRAHGVAPSVVAACNGFDCIGPTLVTRPGLPLVRRFTGARTAAMIGGFGGVQLESEGPAMANETTIDLGDGVKVTRRTAGDFGPPGPRPATTAATEVEAMTAADPPVPGEGDGDGDTVSRDEFNALAAQVAELTDAVNALMESQMAAIEAAAQPLPPIDEPVAAAG